MKIYKLITTEPMAQCYPSHLCIAPVGTLSPRPPPKKKDT